jgi:hypothetical protein
MVCETVECEVEGCAMCNEAVQPHCLASLKVQ